MANNPLAASFRSTNKSNNIVLPGDSVIVTFSAPPQDATDVLISVREDVEFFSDQAVTDRPIGGFRGFIRKGVFTNEATLGAPLPAVPDPVSIRIALGTEGSAPRVFAHMPEPERVVSHRLKLRVEGRINGQAQRFDGTAPIHVEYPLGMVIPGGGAKNDKPLRIVASWAGAQWAVHKKAFRTLKTVPPVRLNRDIQPADYDPWITAIVDAAKAATSGVVAMATGHGDGGDTRSVAWCNLVPEDFSVETEIDKYLLAIDDQILNDGLGGSGGVKTIPGRSSRVVLDALDRLGDALAATSIRRLLLHTCRAGANVRFMQMLADRIGVPIVAHTEQITYDDAIGSGTIEAAYVNEAARLPQALRHWPVDHLGPVTRRKSVPPRFAV